MENIFPEKNLVEFLSDAFARFEKKIAFSSLGKTLRYAELDEQSQKVATWLLRETTLDPGDRIIIQLPNLIEYPVVVFAAIRAGLIIVNTNPLYTPAEMKHQFQDSDAKLIFAHSSLREKVKQVLPDTSISNIVWIGDTDEAHSSMNSDSCAVTSLQAIIDSTPSLNEPLHVERDSHDIAVLQYTGGTTGVSKGACLTERNLLSNCFQTRDRLEGSYKGSDEVFICPLPLYHIYAFTVNMLVMFSMGHHSVLIPNPRDIDSMVDQISKVKVTGLSGLNTLFVGLCNNAKFKNLDFSGLKLTISGGTALTSAVNQLWRDTTGCSISEGYGLSETSPVLCLNQPSAPKVGTVGPPVIGTDVVLIDKDGNPANEGEIVVKGPQVMSGYWRRPSATKEAFTQNGYFKTGDIARALGDGSYKIIDRLKDMIIVSGFNVYPNEVEDVLTSFEGVLEAAVIGMPCEKSGEKVCAFVTTGSQVITQAAIMEHCKKFLTAYKVPKELTFLDELPKSTVGKILRRKLR
ncbi:AMP-binding protein [Ningiella sp. W23]|uniref:AMP-binding protein n=1 Tax=Ningiella sp. W23 TaxID=3023715 RepID=UPI0037572226